ncbi:MAG: ATP-binding protein [Phycisphaerae bacterium]
MTLTRIGQVISICGDQAQVALDDSFIETAGQDRQGQLASFAVIPIGETRVVGLITAISAEEKDAPVRMSVHLIGQIIENHFSRGVQQYPMIGDPLGLISQEDLQLILDMPRQNEQEFSSSFPLGRFALNSQYKVYLNGRQFFSKHVAILGNSGSGKSCTVTKIISESIKHPNTQMILFDVHGEYRRAFSDDNNQLLPNVTYLNENDLVVPYWLLRYQELDTLFVDRSDRRIIPNQTSFLKEALLKLKRSAAKNLDLLVNYNIDTPIYFSLAQLKLYAENMNQSRFVLNTNRYAFVRSALRNLTLDEQEQILLTQKAQFNQGNPEGEVPHALYFQSLTGLIDLFDHKLNDHRYDFLLRPIEHARKSPLFCQLFPQVKEDQSDWSGMIVSILKLLTGQLEQRRNLTIVDLSGIPFDIIDLTVGLLSRLIFDFNFYTQSTFRRPIVLIFEEAHNYIPSDTSKQSFARVAIERIAKEGRKYGVSAIIVSQRPSEVSHTVLSQCNNMIVLRLNNPEDQNYITKVISDQFANLIGMLPILSPGEGFVIGDCVPLPLRTLIALPDRRPASGNVDFIEAWRNPQPADQLNYTINRWIKQERPQN